jgi:ribonuclease HI
MNLGSSINNSFLLFIFYISYFIFREMAKKKSKKWYVVWEGHDTGVFDTWAECLAQTKGYPQAKYKSFPSREAAEAAYGGNYGDHIDFSGRSAKAKPVISEEARKAIVWESISVDAACAGNPGVMEYQGVDTKSEMRIFHQKFPLGTNNIGEFLALVHALALLHKQGKNTPIYSDSKIAMNWVRAGKCRTKLARKGSTEQLYQVVERAESWLAGHRGQWSNPLLKWKTKEWGEIPADFGRK